MIKNRLRHMADFFSTGNNFEIIAILCFVLLSISAAMALLAYQIISIIIKNNVAVADSSSLNASNSFNFATAGDWDDNTETYKTARGIDTKEAEVVLGLGDYAYEQNPIEISSWWKNIAVVHDNEIFKGALGNHDDKYAYSKLFKLNESWTYSFNNNGVLFVAINTELEPADKEQKQKVIKILQNSTNVNWKVVFFHKPILTSKTEHEVENQFDKEYCQIFEQYNVNLILHAHNHNYQRSHVLDCMNNEFVRSQADEGFVIANIGTAGRMSSSPHALEQKSQLMATQFDDKFGFLNVDVTNSTQMRGQFIDNNSDQITESFIIKK